MSVPTYKRVKSETDFLYSVWRLNVEIGKACENKPVKYSRSYGDKHVSMAIEALQLCETANTIWMKGKVRKDDYELRRQNFQKARGLVATIGIVFGIYMDVLRDCEGVKVEKLYK